MKKILLVSLVIALFTAFPIYLNAQSKMVSVRIIQNGTPITDTLDNGQVITLNTSSDDAEQENDEMDSLYDDDLDAGWEGDPEDQNILTMGLRFQGVHIPAGATIDSAFLVMYSHEGKSAEDVARITIVGEANGNASTYSYEELITSRVETNTSILWEVNVDWEIWEPYRTPDIKSIVQEIVDLNTWQFGNAMAFMLKGENQGPSDVDNAREFESFENISDPEDGGDGQNHPERVPELLVYYTFESQVVEIPIRQNGEPITDTLDNGQIITFNTSSDDAEQENDEMDSLFDDDLDAGWEGDPEDQNILTAGLRFTDVTIPKGFIIDSAYIQIYSHEGKSAEDVANITIVGEATDHASTYTYESLITTRPHTSASINWVVDVEWGLWMPYRTPDIKTIVQEIVNREGWEAGNALAIMLMGENQGPSDVDNAREFESFENIADPEDGGDGQNHPERVPRLVVYYSAPSAIFNRQQSNSLIVYPNPASDHLTLNLESGSKATISVYNQIGALVMETVTNNESLPQLNVNHLTNGIYMIHVMQQGEHFHSKLIINKQ
ncbi:MAG: T9SS type A sorting domain-containing protein [Bacteroidales bacterium]|nr:T9SS type A sorting domain-containing protein [Bacteroidales bacterium]